MSRITVASITVASDDTDFHIMAHCSSVRGMSANIRHATWASWGPGADFSDDDYREAARRLHGSDEIEIDADAKLSPNENGAWVQAWVFVPLEEV